METKIGEIITINGVSYRIEIAPDESPCEGCDLEGCEKHPLVEKGCYISPHDIIFKKVSDPVKDLINSQKELDPEISKIVDENFWDLV